MLSARFPGGIPTIVLIMALGACVPAEDGPGAPEEQEEEEALSRTAFTDRVENFFEYTPLSAGVPSAFLIHLTDLSDGTPVAEADVELSVRPAGGGDEVTATRAQIGRVTGIYVAELSVPSAGTYDIEFRIRNDRLDDRMLLTGFEVERER